MKIRTSIGLFITIAEINDIAIAARNITVVSHLFLSNIDLTCHTNPTKKPVLTINQRMNSVVYPIIANKFPIE